MAHKGLYKFKWNEQKHIAYDLAVMTAGVVMGVMAIVAIFKFTGFMDLSTVDGADSLKGAAVVSPLSAEARAGATTDKMAAGLTTGTNGNNPEARVTATYPVSEGYPVAAGYQVTDAYSVIVESEASNGYASIGQNDVSFLKFTLNPSASANLKELRFDLDGFASATDVTSMQLYYENKLAEQAPVLDAQAKFANLSIDLEPNEAHQFEVKANISDRAKSGDRAQIGIKDGNGIIIRDRLLNTFEPKGSFPVWSGYISIIGNKK